jgi:hypothetical protein
VKACGSCQKKLVLKSCIHLTRDYIRSLLTLVVTRLNSAFWDGISCRQQRQQVPPECWQYSIQTRLHGIISHTKVAIVKVIIVRTSIIELVYWKTVKIHISVSCGMIPCNLVSGSNISEGHIALVMTREAVHS